MLVTSHIIPEILRMITYVLIARVIGGDTAQQYAIPGVIVLATTRMTISETSGLPVDDVWNKTLGSNVTGALSPATQYLIRALPLAAVAILDSAIVFIILGSMTTTDWATLTGAWLCSLTAVPTGLTLGLVISVASLRTDLHTSSTTPPLVFSPSAPGPSSPSPTCRSSTPSANSCPLLTPSGASGSPLPGIPCPMPSSPKPSSKPATASSCLPSPTCYTPSKPPGPAEKDKPSSQANNPPHHHPSCTQAAPSGIQA